MVKLEEFVRDLKHHRFENVLSYDFKTNCYSSANESYNIFADLQHGLLLDFQTSSGEIGPGKLHYELGGFIPNRRDSSYYKTVLDLLQRTHNGPCVNNEGVHSARAVSLDLHNDLFEHLYNLTNPILRTNNPWKFYSQHGLFLLDSKEAELPRLECERITRQKIRRLPIEVQVMIGAR